MSDPFVPVARPWIDEREADAARRAILSGWVTQGPEVAAFESEFADFVAARHACAVSSCTSALHLALRVAGVGPGDEVVTVSHSFIATANVIRACGAVPVFVDIEPTTFNLDPNSLGQAFSPRTRAVLCVHQLGLPCDLEAILPLARARAVVVIEDAACAIGSEIRVGEAWQRIGRPHADVACFSFHPRKLLTTGDGGMLTTSRGDWDAAFRRLRHHGMSIPDTVRHAARTVLVEEYREPGYNYRLSDIQAAVGRVQLARVPEAVRRRRGLAARYGEILAGIDGLELPREPEWARSNWQSYCVRLPPGCDQRRVMQAMLDDGIATRRGVMCAHRQAAYPPGSWRCGAPPGECACAPAACRLLAMSEEAEDRGLILPLYPQLADADQMRVAAALRRAIASSGHVRAQDG